MIVFNNDPTLFEKGIVANIKDTSSYDIEFHNIHFSAATITDAGGRVFRRERTGRIEEDETGYLVCSECGAVQPEEWTVYYCWSCGARVVEG